MPKIKTNKGAAKRFKVTAAGKIKRKKAFLRHILTSKASGRKMVLRKAVYVDDANLKQIKRLLPYS